MLSGVPETVAAGRAAFARGDWALAEALLAECDPDALTGDELECFAAAAWNASDYERVVPALERAEATYLREGNVQGAARMALHQARQHVYTGQPIVGVGCWTRADKLLRDQPECAEHGLLGWMESRVEMEAGDADRGVALVGRAIDIAQRVGDPDVEALGLHDRGHYLIVRGDIVNGLAALDEATSMALGGRAGPWAAGVVYCGMIWACRYLGDWRRALEWTDVADRWCERTRMGHFPGQCRVHRAEIIRVRGELDAAALEVVGVCEDLKRGNVQAAAWAYGELGEVRIRQGRVDEARDAFRQAIELGGEPQPGLARLRFLEGDPRGALRAIDRVIAEATSLSKAEDLPFLLPVKVSLAIACGEIDAASAGVVQLAAVLAHHEADAHAACLERARCEVALATGTSEAAIEHARRAVRLWSSAGAPFETAHARVLLARAHRADGDEGTARLELEAAAAAFDRLGAPLDVLATNALLDQPAVTERVTRTYMFTDIVDSSKLLDAIGDNAWHDLLGWHDRLLRAAFTDHRGEEVKHEGDGFFVTFEDADAAVACACHIQRDLAAHRREHGFAPRVRIGLHTAEATRHKADYAGGGVHRAARIASSALADEIVASRVTLAEARRPVPSTNEREITMKGFTDKMPVVTVLWQDH